MKLIGIVCFLPLAFAFHSDPRVANVERFYDTVKSLVRKPGYVGNPSTCDPEIKEKLIGAHEKAINDGYEGIQDAIEDSWGAIFGATISICKKIQKANNEAEEDYVKCAAEKNYTSPEFVLSVPHAETTPYLKTLGELWTMSAKFMNFTLNQALLMDVRVLSDFPKPCLDKYKEDTKKEINELYTDTLVMAETANETVAHFESGNFNADDERFATKIGTAPGLSFFSAMCTMWLDLKDPNHYGFKGFYDALKECQKNLIDGA